MLAGRRSQPAVRRNSQQFWNYQQTNFQRCWRNVQTW